MATVLTAPSFNPLPHSKTLFLSGFHANKYVASGLKGIVKFSDALHLRAEAYAFVPGREIIETAVRTAEYSDKQFSGINLIDDLSDSCKVLGMYRLKQGRSFDIFRLFLFSETEQTQQPIQLCKFVIIQLRLFMQVAQVI